MASESSDPKKSDQKGNYNNIHFSKIVYKITNKYDTYEI